MPVIQITDSEILMLNVLGGMRSLVARCAGVTDAKMGSQDGLNADVDGLMAEYAFCKWKNVFPDLAPSPRSGSADCVYKGLRIDIKSTRYLSGKLLATLKDNPDVDIYVLAIVKDREIDFVGWASKEELCREENIKDLGHGRGYCLEQEKLRKFVE